MRELLFDVFAGQPTDPTEAARAAMRPRLPRRIYEEALAGQGAGGYRVLLDGKPAKTPARKLLTLPSRPLAQAVAAEWEAQREVVDPATMPLTRLANTIIDGVASSPAPVTDEIMKYLASDLIFYRADAPEELVVRQQEYWDPIITWAAEELGARFILAEGVVHVTQPERALKAIRPFIPNHPWRLGATHAMTTLTGSALLALAVLRGRVSLVEAWLAAHVDEDWNMEQWGRDELTLERRKFRFAEMRAAGKVLELLT